MEKGPKETYIELRILRTISRIKKKEWRRSTWDEKKVFKLVVLCCGGGIRGIGVGGAGGVLLPSPLWWCRSHCCRCCRCGGGAPAATITAVAVVVVVVVVVVVAPTATIATIVVIVMTPLPLLLLSSL